MKACRAAFVAAVCLSPLGLSACGYDGWVRYPCQEQANWDKPECAKPGCIVTGTCTDYLIPEGIRDEE